MTLLSRVRRRCAARASNRVPALAAALALAAAPVQAQVGFVQHNLVSDIPGLATHLDPQLINPWGISFSATSPFWISAAGVGVANLYDGGGNKQGLIVTIPGPSAGVPSEPTGQVFNGTGAFGLSNGGNAVFLFASTTGSITGWNGAAGTTALTAVTGSSGSAYTGLAIGGSGASARLYGANFGTGQIDVFDGSFTQILTGSFVDPTIPAGYAPFNVQNLGGELYVTYALRDPTTGDEVPGAGNGFIDVFDASGTLLRRLASNGVLNAPWGVTLAPMGFGGFGGSVLVGNFGDGTIHAFNPTTGALIGQLTAPGGAPIVNHGLWGLTFGNGGSGGDPSVLYFAAGLDNETHGLFGSLTATPEPATLGLVASGLALILVGGGRRRRPSGRDGGR